MKFLRLSAPLLAMSVMLAACGGGGGGGGSSPVPNPGGGGGGGGSTPTPTPTQTSSPGPTATPAPTSSPSGGGVPTDKNYALNAEEGPQVNGTIGWYTAGTTAKWAQQNGQPPVGAFGDTTLGASSSNGFGAMDGMSCTPTVEPAASSNTYSVHSFVAIYYNGTLEALPSGIAMKNPTEPMAPSSNAPSGHPSDVWEIEQSQCEYNVHTHDFSGLVHIEDANVSPNSTSPTSPLSYGPSLQSLLDLWGVKLTATGLTVPNGTNLTGPTAIYFGTQGNDVGPHGGFLTDSYSQVSSAGAVPMAWHDTAIIVIGNMPTLPDGKTALPSVEWRLEF